MSTLNTVVYLNHGADHLYGFNTGAQLHESARFDLELAEHLPTAALTGTALEIVFEQLNIDEPEEDWAIAYRDAGRRSLSVGDVVVIAETAWACCPVGWEHITTDELRAAITAT